MLLDSAVGYSCRLDSGGLAQRHTKGRTCRGGGWEPPLRRPDAYLSTLLLLKQMQAG